jgi:ATP-dependent DNA ligase
VIATVARDGPPAGGRRRQERANIPARPLTPDGLDAWKQVIERGYEGYVAKDEAGGYEGGPTRRWLKVKQEH